MGLARVQTKISAVGLGSDSDNSFQPYLGLGVGYKLTKQLSVDAAWDLTKAEFDGSKENVRALSVGLTYAF